MSNSWLPTAHIVVDGNFKAHHMKMRTPEADVELTNGEGFMVNEENYAQHLATAKEILNEVYLSCIFRNSFLICA